MFTGLFLSFYSGKANFLLLRSDFLENLQSH